MFSFHCDFVDPTANVFVTRAANVRQIVAKYSSQSVYPTNANAPAWCTEGSATNYDSTDHTKQYRFAWAQIQYATEMLGGGVPRFDYDFGDEAADSASTWRTDPIRGASLALTTFFPSGTGVAEITSNLSAIAGQAVIGYQWRNPATGKASSALWAQDEPQGSGTTLPPFTFDFPISTATALIVDPHDWSRTLVNAANGTVPVPLNRDDPSPPYMVIEQ